LLGEILWTGKIIQQVIGVFPTYFRPPVGDIDERTRAVIQSVGLKIVVWNQDSSDWFFSTIPPQNNFTEAQEIAKFKFWIAHPSEAGTMQEGNTNGFISLQHDLFNRSANMAIPTLQLVLKAGYHVMPVGHCIGDQGSWYVSWEDTNSTVLYSKPTTTTTRPTVPVATLDPLNSDAETEDMNTFAVDTAVVSHHSKAVLSRRITEWILEHLSHHRTNLAAPLRPTILLLLLAITKLLRSKSGGFSVKWEYYGVSLTHTALASALVSACSQPPVSEASTEAYKSDSEFDLTATDIVLQVPFAPPVVQVPLAPTTAITTFSTAMTKAQLDQHCKNQGLTYSGGSKDVLVQSLELRKDELNDRIRRTQDGLVLFASDPGSIAA
ncbi:chitin deacetylase, partial [Rhizoclosmatium sp. JEL0117]